MLLEQVTAVFVDILGFAHLVIDDEGAIPLLDPLYNSSMSLDDLLEYLDGVHPRPSSECLVFFHRGLVLEQRAVNGMIQPVMPLVDPDGKMRQAFICSTRYWDTRLSTGPSHHSIERDFCTRNVIGNSKR